MGDVTHTHTKQRKTCDFCGEKPTLDLEEIAQRRDTELAAVLHAKRPLHQRGNEGRVCMSQSGKVE